MEELIAVVMTKKTEENICIKADEARILCASKLSEICRRFMKEANNAIISAASNGKSQVIFPCRDYTEVVTIFCTKWLNELGYTANCYSERVVIKW